MYILPGEQLVPASKPLADNTHKTDRSLPGTQLQTMAAL